MALIPTAYSRDLTSYDFLKALALILMVLDHVGYYFFPEELWWRTFGRICAPAWLFLIGYASSRDLSLKMWVGASSLIILDQMTGVPVLPFNILATIIVIRLCLNPLMNFSLGNHWRIWVISVFLLIWFLPSWMTVEYGTHGLILAMMGYLVRNRDMVIEKLGNDKLVFQYTLFSFVSYLLITQSFFNFSSEQFAFVAIGTFIMHIFLYANFKKETYPELTKKMGKPLTLITQFLGRRTLEFYVLHLFIFQLVSMYYFELTHLLPRQ